LCVSSLFRVLVRQELTLGPLRAQDHPLLASSLQTAHNLLVLPSLVDSLLADLNDLVLRSVKACFDMASLSREVGGKGALVPLLLSRLNLTDSLRATDGPVNAASAFVYKSRTRNEPTQATMPQWSAVFWGRLENLVTDLGSVCIKVRPSLLLSLSRSSASADGGAESCRSTRSRRSCGSRRTRRPRRASSTTP